MSHSATELDIVPVTPHVDLVLFDNVLSCYPCNKDLTATYTLGEAVQQSTWDWVGVFRTEWRYLGEYVAYRWASSHAPDVTAPSRRAVCFPSCMVETTDDWRTTFQLLYVSNGNHVVGVSPPFRFGPAEFEDDLHITSLFRELEISEPSSSGCRQTIKQKGKGKKRLHDTCEFVDECGGAVPRKRPCSKQKITKVYRDPETLVNIPADGLSHKLNIVRFYPPEKTGNSQTTQQPIKMKIFDVDWQNKNWLPNFQRNVLATFDVNANIKAIDFHRKPTLVYNPVTSQDFTVCRSEAGCSRSEEKDTVTESDVAEKGNSTFVESLKGARRKTNRALTQKFENIFNWLMLQSYNVAPKHQLRALRESIAVPGTSKQEQPRSPSYNDWLVWEPKKIVRLKKMLQRERCATEGLIQTVQDRDAEIVLLKAKVRQLQGLLQVADNASERFQRLSETLTSQIRDILSQRAKDHTNEWRQFVRQVQERTTQTSSTLASVSSSRDDSRPCSSSGSNSSSSSRNSKARPAPRHSLCNKHMSKVLAVESQPRSKLHKGRAQAEQCPTCGLKFSGKADRHVIEEHILFHDRAKKLN